MLNKYNLLCHFRLVELTQRKEEEEEIEVRLDIQDNLTVLEEIKTIEENERKEVINLILPKLILCFIFLTLLSLLEKH